MDSTPLTPCPDCAAAAEDNRLTHEDTCPLGRGLDEFRETDREWFEQHPNATSYRRPVHWAEIAQLRHVGALPPYGDVVGRVEVIQLQPGIRVRRFGDVAVVVGSAA